MNVTRLEAIERIPLAIDYRRMYQAHAILNIADRDAPPVHIEFSLELSPFGGNEVSVRFLESADFPLVPAIRVLKEHITAIDKAGSLP